MFFLNLSDWNFTRLEAHVTDFFILKLVLCRYDELFCVGFPIKSLDWEQTLWLLNYHSLVFHFFILLQKDLSPQNAQMFHEYETLTVQVYILLQTVHAKKQTISQRCIACGYTGNIPLTHKVTTYILKNPPDMVCSTFIGLRLPTNSSGILLFCVVII